MRLACRKRPGSVEAGPQVKAGGPGRRLGRHLLTQSFIKDSDLQFHVAFLLMW